MGMTALEELRQILQAQEVKEVLATAELHPGRPTAARFLRIYRLAVLVAEGEGKGP